MALLRVAEGKYVNTERVTYVAQKKDKVIIEFQNEVIAVGI